MGKVDVYIGGYLTIDEVTKEESDRLASVACIVGMPLTISYNAETSEFKALMQNGDSIGTVHPKNKLAMREAFEEGWTCACCLSLVYYENATKQFKGELVYQMFHVKPSQTTEQANLEAYTKKTAERIAAGKRPSVTVNGHAWDQIVTTGDWATTDEEPLPVNTTRNSGVVIYKRKRSISNKLTAAAMNKNPGCYIGLIAALVLLVGAVVFGVWSCTAGA